VTINECQHGLMRGDGFYCNQCDGVYDPNEHGHTDPLPDGAPWAAAVVTVAVAAAAAGVAYAAGASLFWHWALRGIR